MKVASIIFLLLIPFLCFGQFKKDVEKPNVSESLNFAQYNNSFLGFLDPSRLHMSHSVSMSYMSIGGNGMMVNSYVNTLNYQFNENWILTTKLGIMNSPYNSLPGNTFLNESEFFGGAELKYKPSEKSVFTIRFEKTPYYYNGSGFYNRNPFNILDNDW